MLLCANGKKTLFQRSDIIKCKLEYPDRRTLLLAGRQSKPNSGSQSGPVGTQTEVSPWVEEKPAHHVNCYSFSGFVQISIFGQELFCILSSNNQRIPSKNNMILTNGYLLLENKEQKYKEYQETQAQLPSSTSRVTRNWALYRGQSIWKPKTDTDEFTLLSQQPERSLPLWHASVSLFLLGTTVRCLHYPVYFK